MRRLRTRPGDPIGRFIRRHSSIPGALRASRRIPRRHRVGDGAAATKLTSRERSSARTPVSSTGERRTCSRPCRCSAERADTRPVPAFDARSARLRLPSKHVHGVVPRGGLIVGVPLDPGNRSTRDRPALAARVLVLDADGAVLLLRGFDPARVEAGSWWFTPGGGVDEGETLAAAACRELFEETGLRVEDPGPALFERTIVFDFEASRSARPSTSSASARPVSFRRIGVGATSSAAPCSNTGGGPPKRSPRPTRRSFRRTSRRILQDLVHAPHDSPG